MSPKYSVVVPVYNEENCIEETCRRLRYVMDSTGENYELLFVNDGSRDASADILSSLCRQDERVKVLNLSRNFGHQIAVTAGLHHSSGQAVVIIDADLQDPPEVIMEMIEKWKSGYDVVYGKRLEREGETLFKRASASVFYRLLKSMTDVEIPVDTGDFRLMDRKVCDVAKQMREKSPFVRGLVSWVGFEQTSVEYTRDERFAGETKYPLKKMMKFGLDAITSFSYKPLKLASYLGFIVSGFSFLYLLVVVYQKLFTDTTVPGWASIVAVMLLFNGIVLIMLGIIGQYIGKIYDETKNRPLYIVSEKIGFQEEAAKISKTENHEIFRL